MIAHTKNDKTEIVCLSFKFQSPVCKPLGFSLIFRQLSKSKQL